MNKKILVSISCFDDFDVIQTVRHMKDMAYDSSRLRIVVILQTNRPELFKDLDAEVYQYPLNWASGCGKSRAAAMRKYSGEDYFFQTDSHMRFVRNWEQLLIDELEVCKSPKPVLSTLPPGFVIKTGEVLGHSYNEIRFREFYRNIPITIGTKVEIDLSTIKTPRATPFIAGGVFFSRGSVCTEIPYDPYMFFHGEEHAFNMRLWTNGYDNFSPRFCFCYHAYRYHNSDFLVNIDSYISIEESSRLHERSLARVQVLTGCKQSSEVSNQDFLIDLDKYCLGTVRTVSQWEDKFNIYLKSQTRKTTKGR